MIRIIYNGNEEETLHNLRKDLPEYIEIIVIRERIKDVSHFVAYSPDAIILPFTKPWPEPDDLVWLQAVKEIPNIPKIIVIAQMLSVSQAVSIMRSGAYDCLHGQPSGAILGLVMDRLMNINKNIVYDNQLILGNSPAICSLRDKLNKYAEKDFPVLITGETGSGKELVAKTLHLISKRKNRPFVPVNCSLFPDNLIATELFGSCQGAFTGAENRIGLLESAHEGTIFLDEITDLSMESQAKLLRFCEEKTIRRIGSNYTKRIDVRIIAASNKIFSRLVKENKFRPDLYYRLNTLNVDVPPLRQRKEDIPLLARAHLNLIPEVSNHIDDTAINALSEYDWPGNVRELQSVVLRAAIEANGEPVSIDHISFL